MVLKIIIGLVLISHGIGHSLGFFPLLGWSREPGWTGDSRILNGLIGAQPAHAVGFALWLVALVGFLVAGLAVLGLGAPAGWARPLAATTAVVSLAGLALFWNAFPGLGPKIAAILVDLAVLWAVLLAHWPPGDVVPG